MEKRAAAGRLKLSGGGGVPSFPRSPAPRDSRPCRTPLLATFLWGCRVEDIYIVVLYPSQSLTAKGAGMGNGVGGGRGGLLTVQTS